MSLTLEQRVERLEAIEDIKRLKALYCLHCDRDYDPDALAQLFTPDAVWDAGPLRGVHSGRDAIHRFFSRAAEKIPYAAHLVMNPIIDVNGDEASGVWRMIQPCSMKADDGSVFAAFQVARYDETYRKSDGNWLIAHLKVRLRRLPVPAAEWIDLSGEPKA